MQLALMAWTRYHGPVAPPLMPAAWTILRAYQAGAPPGHRIGQVRQLYSATEPAMHVTVPPPTQTWPSSSRETCTRPRRPSTVPWLATYGAVTRPAEISHCAREAFRLPVTGSSPEVPSPLEKSARTSSASGDPAG